MSAAETAELVKLVRNHALNECADEQELARLTDKAQEMLRRIDSRMGTRMNDKRSHCKSAAALLLAAQTYTHPYTYLLITHAVSACA